MKKRTDNEIIELFWMRNETAIRETAAKYGNYCFSVANNILGNREDAEECCHICNPTNIQKEEAAWQFVRELLSNEWQGTVDGFPVTKESFEERVTGALSREDLELTDEDISQFLELINVTEVFIHNDIRISGIILEEAQTFFEGVKSADEVTGIMNSRIKLYLEEQE
ncbi:MAG: hypothetical protein IJQ21_03435 [Lachnospiraceae bacterium]|nr:hypothetical protein [Lachnospiraceae bacterium]